MSTRPSEDRKKRNKVSDRTKGAVLITGASSGIGKACALLFSGKGYPVYAGVRTREAEVRLGRETKGSVEPILLDVTCRDHIERVARLVEKSAGHPHGIRAVVNNAGIVMGGPLEYLPLQHLRRILEVNVLGQIAIIQVFLPMLRRTGGRIVNIGSPSGFLAPPLLGPYAASKFALEAATDALRREVDASGVQVSLIEPGAVETGVWDKSMKEAERWEEGLPREAKERYSSRMQNVWALMSHLREKAMPPENVAQVVLRAVESRRPKPRYLVGMDAWLQCLLARFCPVFLTDRLLDGWMFSRSWK